MKRPAGVTATGLPSLAQRELSMTLSMYRQLNELLSLPNWDDGTPKGKICLMIFSDDTTVRILLKLEQDKLKTSVVGRTLDDALAALEKMLASGQVIWEQDSGGSQPRRKNGK